MPIELSKEVRDRSVASIERFFRETTDERIGNIAAEGLLRFFLAEIAPSVYNKAVNDTQERIQVRAAELDIEVHESEFQYWKSLDKQIKRK
jgi:uncharacterized protein (DUF2164 family)